MIQLYNTLTKQKEEFKPQVPGQVLMYVCGPTVYNYIHIGNARSAIAFDTVRRYFEYRGYQVKYVSNFTDVDDKIIKASQEMNLSVEEVTAKFIAAFYEDTAALNVKKASLNPRVMENMADIINFVADLIAKGYAYEVQGDVYYRARKFKHYGQLSGQSIDALEQGASERLSVEDQAKKEDPLDFALWKAAKPGEISWQSPWGLGRPGWHIECSVMATKYLGKTIDIHAGGEDLIFPHHENEIAQSEAANGKEFARYWMHNGFLNIDNRKMSKSLGNFFTVREIGEKYDLQVLRFFMLSAHYRSPLNFSAELMEAAKSGLERIVTAAGNLKFLMENAKTESMSEEEKQKYEASAQFTSGFEKAMDDDFNTADAIAAVFEYVKFINTSTGSDSSKEYLEKLYKRLETLTDVLGIIVDRKEEMLDADIEALIEERQAARKEKNFARADEIREELLEKGIILEDTREGVKWKRA